MSDDVANPLDINCSTVSIPQTLWVVISHYLYSVGKVSKIQL